VEVQTISDDDHKKPCGFQVKGKNATNLLNHLKKHPDVKKMLDESQKSRKLNPNDHKLQITFKYSSTLKSSAVSYALQTVCKDKTWECRDWEWD
jgi:hypothetical protein